MQQSSVCAVSELLSTFERLYCFLMFLEFFGTALVFSLSSWSEPFKNSSMTSFTVGQPQAVCALVGSFLSWREKDNGNSINQQTHRKRSLKKDKTHLLWSKGIRTCERRWRSKDFQNNGSSTWTRHLGYYCRTFLHFLAEQKQHFMTLKAWLKNIVAEKMFLVVSPGVAKLGNICLGRNICVREAKMFLTPWQKTFFVSEQQNLFPQHMVLARLNWETFASATMFPQCFRNNVS